jgi:hypothetical protein
MVARAAAASTKEVLANNSNNIRHYTVKLANGQRGMQRDVTRRGNCGSIDTFCKSVVDNVFESAVDSAHPEHLLHHEWVNK